MFSPLNDNIHVMMCGSKDDNSKGISISSGKSSEVIRKPPQNSHTGRNETFCRIHKFM